MQGWLSRLFSVRAVASALGLFATLLYVFAGPATAPAAAAAPEFLLQIPEDSIVRGEGAGQLDGPGAVASDATSGHIYVSDADNTRISEFTAWGSFVKAWGWGVVESGPGDKAQNEIQQLTVDATGGSFALLAFQPPGAAGSREQTTTPLPFDASAAAVQSGLEALLAFEPGDVAVSGPAGGPWTIEFEGNVADTDILPLQVVSSSLTGGGASAAVQTLQGGASFEICVPANGDVCQTGQGYFFGEGGGAAPGQFTNPNDIALDAGGNVYVSDTRGEGEKNARVQKFDSEGNFLLMFGGEVNKTTKAGVCTKADLEGGDQCGVGVPGTADGQLSTGSHPLVHNPATGTIFVGDQDRIQEFNTNGTFKAKIDFEAELAAFDGEAVTAIDADSVGSLYVALAGVEGVHKLSPTGELLEPTFELAEAEGPFFPTELAGDQEGNVYVAFDPPSGSTKATEAKVVAFDSAGGLLISATEAFASATPAPAFVNRHGIFGLATGSACGGGTDVYATYSSSGDVSYLKAFGAAPIACEDPPKRPPEIQDQYAVSVDTDAAALKAQINPRFWPDATYHVQYGSEPCTEGGCEATHPLPPGTGLTKKSINATLTTAGVFLSGLEPGTTYHYRFAAQSGGSEGEPVVGVGGKPGAPGTEGTFRTFPLAADPDTDCPNQAFRTGPSALLPDCRAYEMVSPLDKNNGDILTAPGSHGAPAALLQSAASGQRFTYSSLRSFGDPAGAPATSQYLAERDPVAGWLSEAISPPRTRVLDGVPVDSEFQAFSDDLCRAWLRHDSDPPLAEGAVAGYNSFYRRENCGAGKGSYESLAPGVPPHKEPNAKERYEAQGFSSDGSLAFFVAQDNLPGSGAPDNPEHLNQLYVHQAGAGAPRFVCILPGGSPTSQPCYAGILDPPINARSLHNAVSDDGSRVFWTESPVTVFKGVGPGRIYLREHPEQGAVEGECTEASKPCTIAVSQEGEKARFWGAAADGSKAIFTIEDAASPLNRDLYSFDVEEASPEPELIAKKTKGLLGISEDASHVYFVSEEKLTGEEANSEGAKAEEGKPNLYLHEEGSGTSFVATLSAVDAGGALSPVSIEPLDHTARVSADGRHAVFMSTAPLTGYNNTDVNSGKAAAEVFRYDADQAQLLCVSCNPSGARPTGAHFELANSSIWAAARIPGSERPLYGSRLLSEGGDRLFFESFEALVSDDTNGVRDVYQWEEAGRGGCEKADPTFNPEANGCVDLISSGQSPRESNFLDASPDGENVFISTLSSLVPQDYGLVDVYDARVEGGFPSPEPSQECEAETCQSPPPAPEDITPASVGFEGQGDFRAKPRPRCPKGKRKIRRAGKARCVKRSGRQGRQNRQRQRHHRGVTR